MSTAILKTEVQTRIDALTYPIDATVLLQNAVDTVGLGLDLTNIISVLNSSTAAIDTNTPNDDVTALNAASIALGVTSKGTEGTSKVNDVKQIVSTEYLIEADNQTWLKSGVLSTDIASYPDAYRHLNSVSLLSKVSDGTPLGLNPGTMIDTTADANFLYGLDSVGNIRKYDINTLEFIELIDLPSFSGTARGICFGNNGFFVIDSTGLIRRYNSTLDYLGNYQSPYTVTSTIWRGCFYYAGYFYYVSSVGNVYRWAASNGTSNSLLTTAANTTGMDYNASTGKVYGVSQGIMYTYDPSSLSSAEVTEAIDTAAFGITSSTGRDELVITRASGTETFEFDLAKLTYINTGDFSGNVISNSFDAGTSYIMHSDGNVYSYVSGVYSGSPIVPQGTVSTVQGITVEGGNMWILDNSGVVQCDLTGAVVTPHVETLSFITTEADIAHDPVADTLWILDKSVYKAIEVTKSIVPTGRTIDTVDFPYSIEVGEDNVFIGYSYGNIRTFNRDGSLAVGEVFNVGEYIVNGLSLDGATLYTSDVGFTYFADVTYVVGDPTARNDGLLSTYVRIK